VFFQEKFLKTIKTEMSDNVINCWILSNWISFWGPKKLVLSGSVKCRCLVDIRTEKAIAH
jgi:hypothetical protein